MITSVSGWRSPPNELRTITCRARVLSGEYRWFSFTCRYLYEGSQPYMAVGKIVDITKQRETEELLTRKSQMDGLTKTFNKMAFQEKMAALLPETGRGLLFVIDMDRFKQVNDEYGHSMGDRVLEEVARSLLDVFRHRDPVGRVGGDEFVVFPAPAAEAEYEARMRAVSESLAAQGHSISYGIAVCEAANGLRELVREADEKMLGSKRAYYAEHDRRRPR